MNPLAAVETNVILSGRSDWIGTDTAETLSEYPLESIETEFPHFVGSVDSPNGVERPKERHPVFFGCYDWHSSVHSHWALIRQLRLFDDHPAESEIRARIDARFTPENIEREVEYFEDNPSFEKPYGWAWLLHLASELYRWEDDDANEWGSVLGPLEHETVSLVESEFLPQKRPFRVGTHQNSAFALHCILDYARTTDNESLEATVCETATEFFADDRDYPVEYEPLGWDFLSPALTEADLMRRVYGRYELEAWLDRFLPDVTIAPHDTILEPVHVASNPDEGVALHLAGLNVSKAWCLAGLASALDGHRYADVFERSAKRHTERGLNQAFTDDYAGSHWLSSFVLYLLTRNDGGIAPP
ncbi:MULTISPECIES: DUF2891 domain-containing protein [unclassified Haladaptatus]|uniref:DUF2891 domain-containing protein n=1 Tax=unclassified Haladaptatus TaxID=2622732 RepID=UPI00209C6CBA|nr:MULTISPECIES: DUF2891 domain-containing protein [unclassified Haladaptatus]MCO8242723.1 DUF2891 domain-containing protein [Haladaptatus sp. AB643]MCO8252482.1 DUF2891 domain-containing protein [Haladaptatus sp. AB618]